MEISHAQSYLQINPRLREARVVTAAPAANRDWKITAEGCGGGLARFHSSGQDFDGESLWHSHGLDPGGIA